MIVDDQLNFGFRSTVCVYLHIGQPLSFLRCLPLVVPVRLQSGLSIATCLTGCVLHHQTASGFVLVSKVSVATSSSGTVIDTGFGAYLRVFRHLSGN